MVSLVLLFINSLPSATYNFHGSSRWSLATSCDTVVLNFELVNGTHSSPSRSHTSLFILVCGASTTCAVHNVQFSTVKADSHIACRAHAVPLPCRAAKVLEYVFRIWFTQCGRIWFTRTTPRPCHAPTMPFLSRPQHGRRETAMLCRGLEKNDMVRARYLRGMSRVNQTRPDCVNQMGKTHSKPLEARHGRGTAWARHAMCESALILPVPYTNILLNFFPPKFLLRLILA